jgi:acetate kinase
MTEDLIGVVNAGSSSLKFSVYADDECLLNGQVDGIGGTRRGDHTPTELLTGRSRGWPALG